MTLFEIGAAYIRVSTERQDEYSPDSQLKLIREKAAKDGVQIPDEYVFYDDGISGRSVKKRNDFNRMIALAKEKSRPFKAIYVWKFSRFARNQEESLVYKNLLKKNNVSVISISETIPEGPFGSLIERIIEWMDEFYSINLSTEVTRGMTEKIQRGEPVCPAPFGYHNEGKSYVLDEEEAKIVYEVFTRYSQGEGMRAIAVNLGKRGIRTKQGNMPESRWVEYMLHNPAYIGNLRWSMDGARAVSKRDYCNENIITINAKHEPIIPIELWSTVQDRLEREKKLYPKYAKREQPIMYMTKGILRCDSCGGTMAMATAGSGKNKTLALQCCNYAKGICHVSHFVTMHKIEAAIISGLKQAIGTKEFTISPERRKPIKKEAPDYEKLLAIEERKLTRAKEAYLSGIDDIKQYSINKSEIETRISELIELKNKDTTLEPLDTSIFADKVAKVVELIESPDVTPAVKNEALRTIIDKIIYDKVSSNVAILFNDL